jgi:hypothetical protein
MVRVRIGDVWDQTVDVLRGRAGILAGIAFAALVGPGVIAAALGTIIPLAGGAMALVPLVRLAVIVLMILAMLAVTAVASDPAVDRAQAFRIAGQRLLPALGLLVLLVVVAALLFVPAGVLLALSGARMNAAGTIDMSGAASGYSIAAAASVLLAVVLALWFSARIVPLFGIVVNERHGIGALRRSLALTRGATLRLIGVLILYFIVTSVAMFAGTMVVGVIARLALGAEALGSVRFVVAVVSTLISAAATVLQSVFYARFYVTAQAQEQRMAPLS